MTAEQEERYLKALETIAQKMPNLCNNLGKLAEKIAEANAANERKK